MQTTTTNNSVIRLRRFTRKAYAAFCSVQRIVTIGQLTVDIANCQLRKSSAWFSTNHLFSTQNIEEDLEETPQEFISTEALLLAPITVANPSNGIAACVCLNQKIIYIRSCCST